MSVSCVLFDLVGTLLDERRDHLALDRMMEHVRARWGLSLSARELSGRFALALMEIIDAEPDVAQPADFVPFHEAAPDIFGGLLASLGYDVSSNDKAWFWSTYLDVQRRTWRPVRRAAAVLNRLGRAGLVLGAVTDGDRYLLDDILPRTALERAVTVRVSAEESGHVRPHAASFELALHRAGVGPDDAVFVGTSLERDIEGALAAGIERTVLVDRHDARVTSAPKIRRLGQLPRTMRAHGWWPSGAE